MSTKRLAYSLVVLVVICLPSITMARCLKGVGLIVLSEDPAEAPSLVFGSNTVVEIKDGSIQVNMISPHPPVSLEGGQVTVYAEEFNTVSSIDSTDEYIFDPVTGLRLTTSQPKIPDPYRDVPAPVPNPATPKSGYFPLGGVPVVFEPGYYPDGIDKISTGDNVTFLPGVYVIGGGPKGKDGLEITGGVVCAKGVLFYITEDAHIKITGGSPSTDIVITEILSEHAELQTDCNDLPITYSQGLDYVTPYKGMIIFQDRTNTNNADIDIQGSEVEIGGTIYFPNNHLDLGSTPTSLGNQVIADTLTIHGTGNPDGLIINCDGRNQFPVLVGDIGSSIGLGICDGFVDCYDLHYITEQWLEETSSGEDWLLSDLNYDRITNLEDFSEQAINWK